MIFWIYGLPLWVFALSIMAVFLLAMELGAWNGRRIARISGTERAGRRTSKSDLEVGALLALLGLVLAFTYSFGLTRIDTRKQALLREANAIGTAFLRADLLPEPNRSEVRERLLSYAGTRVFSDEARRDITLARREIDASLIIQKDLWPTTKAALLEEVPGHIQILMVQAMNDILDAHAARMSAGFDRIPPSVFLFTVILAALGVGLASQNAAAEGSLKPARMVLFALSLSALIFLIADFDNSSRGLIQLDQRVLNDLVVDMNASLR